MQTPSVALNIGADVGKDDVAMACAEASFAPRKIHNQRAALLAFLKDLPAGSRIGMESTGIYHELLAELAHRRGFVVYVLNPKDTHHYAKAMGLRGKTDRVDAELIARMIAHEHAKLHPWIPPTPEQRQIDRLLKRRAKVSRIRAALTQSFKGVDGFAAEIKSLRQRLDKLLAGLDAKVKTLIEASTERKQDYTRLRKIGGVGAVVGSSVLNTLERVPFKSADAFVAFTGLDPRPDESGHHRGRRRLSKRGPSELRRLLYLAAMAAAKTKTWKPEQEGYPPPQLWSSSHGTSRVPPGRSTPTRPCSIRSGSRRLLDMNHRISMAGLRVPLSTLRAVPHDTPRMTRGQCGLLRLHCEGLSPFTLCRSPGATATPCSPPTTGSVRSIKGKLEPQQIHDATLESFVSDRLAADAYATTIDRSLEVVRTILNRAARSYGDVDGRPWLKAISPLISMLAESPPPPLSHNVEGTGPALSQTTHSLGPHGAIRREHRPA